ncbi:GNAT family N-acetyltransferase [Arthrobacter sp. BHU FT2]|nr:GNAT family N-acetyltransferase [Arthrobacter sp. BHU FT2]
MEAAIIRAARESEYAEVGELTYRGFGHHLPGARQPDAERLNLLVDAQARAAAGDLLVAEDTATGQLVGTVTVLHHGSALARQAEPGEVEVRLLAVLPEARRRGLGWQLLDRASEIAVAQGAERIVLDTGVDNHGSQNLYERFGYVRRPDREKPRPAPKVQLAVFTLDLASGAESQSGPNNRE